MRLFELRTKEDDIKVLQSVKNKIDHPSTPSNEVASATAMLDKMKAKFIEKYSESPDRYLKNLWKKDEPKKTQSNYSYKESPKTHVSIYNVGDFIKHEARIWRINNINQAYQSNTQLLECQTYLTPIVTKTLYNTWTDDVKLYRRGTFSKSDQSKIVTGAKVRHDVLGNGDVIAVGVSKNIPMAKVNFEISKNGKTSFVEIIVPKIQLLAIEPSTKEQSKENPNNNSYNVEFFTVSKGTMLRYTDPIEKSDKVWGLFKENGKYFRYWGKYKGSLQIKEISHSDGIKVLNQKMDKGYREVPVENWVLTNIMR